MSVKIDSQKKVAKAYISVSHNNRQLLSKELTAVIDTLAQFNIVSLIFVDQYTFGAAEEQQMMRQAMEDIDHCDLLIAETSHKGIGIGVEVGYAKARNKPVIYLRHKNAEHSTTVSGISDFHVVYEGALDLQQQLSKIVHTIGQNV